jgi:hypothetical protein
VKTLQRPLWLALWALVLLASTSARSRPGADGDLLEFGRLELHGPLQSVFLEMGAAGQTRVELGLAAGESRELIVPLPPRALDERAPRIQVYPKEGRAVFVGWVSGDERRLEWESHSPRLRQRTRPPVKPGQIRATLPSLALALATALLVIGLRSSPPTAFLLACALGCGSVWLVGAQGDSVATRVRVMEGLGNPNGPGLPWLLARSAAGPLSVEPGDCLRMVGTQPGRLRWEVALGEWGHSQEVQLDNGTLTALSNLDPQARRCAPERNDWGTMDRVWTRTEDGSWHFHGVWEWGEPLPGSPPEVPSAGGPPVLPGWLSAGLPMGKTVLVAHMAEGSWAGPPRAAGEDAWLRWVAWTP